MTADHGARDWRGTPITPGALVIYGAQVGRSVTLVEARVADPMCTPSGRIWLEVIRRSYGGWLDAERVHVGADRLTVVDTLPPTALPSLPPKARGWHARHAGTTAAESRAFLRTLAESRRWRLA